MWPDWRSWVSPCSPRELPCSGRCTRCAGRAAARTIAGSPPCVRWSPRTAPPCSVSCSRSPAWCCTWSPATSVWEACASLAIGVLLVCVAYWLAGTRANSSSGAPPTRRRAVGSGPCWRRNPRSTAWRRCSPCSSASTRPWSPPDRPRAGPGQRGGRGGRRPHQTLRRHTVPEADQIFLDVTDAGALQDAAGGNVAAESPAATGERGGA